MADSIVTIIGRDAAKPQSGTVDGVSITKRSLTELIAADKYLKGSAAVASPAGCVTFVKIIQPGTINE